MRKGPLVGVVCAGLIAASAPAAQAGWRDRIERIVGGRSVGVAVRLGGEWLAVLNARHKRVPASNQKLLLSMALFDHLRPSTRLQTGAGVEELVGSTVTGDLYLLGSGDPTLTGGGAFARNLPVTPTRLRLLAKRIVAAGVARIEGGVVGSIHYFSHDWFAPGWKSYFPSDYIPLPSALAFDGNAHRGSHISDPELRAARSLTRKLRALGVDVGEPASAGAPPPGLDHIARVRSRPLRALVRYMNRSSSNFFAEMLGKRLGVARYGRPGSIAKGAAAIQSWAAGRGVGVEAFDSSGLSYDNRVSPSGLVRLLTQAADESWGGLLRRGLARPGQGTLEDRLGGVPVRAKTGTLVNISTLSGWVWLKRAHAWAAFSVMARGLPKYRAAAIEDRIVRTLHARAR